MLNPHCLLCLVSTWSCESAALWKQFPSSRTFTTGSLWLLLAGQNRYRDQSMVITISLKRDYDDNCYDHCTVFQVPGFTDLTLNDQMKLLQSSWTEVVELFTNFILILKRIQQLLIIQHSLLLANEWDKILATTKYVQQTMTGMENLDRCWPSPSSTGLFPSWAALTLPQTSPSPRFKSDSSKKCLVMIMIIIGRLFSLWPRPILWQGSEQSQ